MRLTIEPLWVLATLELSFILVASTPISPPDLWWTLKLGELALQQGQPLQQEVFTFTPAPPSLANVQWLAQLALYGLFAVGGLELVILANALLALGLYAGLLWLCWRTTDQIRAACVATFAAYLLGLSNLGARPQLLAYPLFLVCLIALWRSARRPGWLLAIPPLVALWANVHGSFFLGPALAGLFLVGHLIELATAGRWGELLAARAVSLTATTLGAALALLANPYGLGAIEYAIQLSRNRIVRDFVTEWAPTTVETWYGLLFFGSVALVFTVLYATRRTRPLNATEGLLLLAFGFLGAASVRGIIWWGLAMAPILALRLAHLPGLAAAEQRSRGRPTSRARQALTALAMSVSLLAAVAALPWFKSANPLVPGAKSSLVSPETPVAVAGFLNSQPPGQRLYHDERWGGYFDWAVWPRHRLFVDGRVEAHQEQVWLDYLSISFGQVGWEQRLEKYGVTMLVLSVESQASLIDLASRSEQWCETYRDGQAVVFERASRAASGK